MSTLTLSILSTIAFTVFGVILWRQAAAKHRADRLFAKYGYTTKGQNVVNRVVWVGETEEELVDSLGKPKNVIGDVRRYGYGRTVTVKDGVVTEWTG